MRSAPDIGAREVPALIEGDYSTSHTRRLFANLSPKQNGGNPPNPDIPISDTADLPLEGLMGVQRIAPQCRVSDRFPDNYERAVSKQMHTS